MTLEVFDNQRLSNAGQNDQSAALEEGKSLLQILHGFREYPCKDISHAKCNVIEKLIDVFQCNKCPVALFQKSLQHPESREACRHPHGFQRQPDHWNADHMIQVVTDFPGQLDESKTLIKAAGTPAGDTIFYFRDVCVDRYLLI